MIVSDGICCTTSAEIQKSAREVFQFVTDPIQVGGWALGSFGPLVSEQPGVFKGHSLFDNSPAWFSIDGDTERLLVDYLVGTPGNLLPRITIRIIPGEGLNKAPGTCVVSLIAWRVEGMDDERWNRLCACHETEVLLIKSQVESKSK